MNISSGLSLNDIQASYAPIEKLISTGNDSQAIDALKEFIKEKPDVARAHNDLAILHYRIGNKLQTLGHYEKAVRLAPENPIFRKNLASFYFVEMGWTDEAIFIYTDLLASYPSDTEVLGALGLISSALERHEEARAFWGRIIELEPWNMDAQNALQGLETGISLFREEPEKPASPPATDSGLTDLNSILASIRETISGFENTHCPDDGYKTALALLEQGNEEAAIEKLEQLIHSNPNFAMAHNDLGVILQRRGEINKALVHLETAVRIEPASPTFGHNLAGLYFSELDRTDDAIRVLTEVLRGNPSDVAALSGLAQIALTVGRSDDASIFLEKVVELEPTNQIARELLSKLNRDSSFFLNKS